MMASENSGFNPNWVSAPGETITDILNEKGLSLADLSTRLNEPVKKVQNLIEGRTSVTIELARRLEEALGGSVEFWMARDYQYREDVARLRSGKQEWLDKIPLADMIQFGWLDSEPHPADELEACLQFFDVSSVDEWRRRYFDAPQLAALRTSPTYDTQPEALAVWLRQAEREARSISCDSWNSEGFHSALSDVRSLTRRKAPSEFLPRLREECAKHGVAVVILKSPTGCRASGATRFLSASKALLLLSCRHLSDDHFWFTFFHEAGHLVLHGKDRLFVEGIENEFTSEEEQEANEFAAEVLVPPEYQDDMMNLPVHGKKIIRFARKVGVAPGIIVGQLQHYGKLDFDQLNSLKRRYEWEDDRISLEKR